MTRKDFLELRMKNLELRLGDSVYRIIGKKLIIGHVRFIRTRSVVIYWDDGSLERMRVSEARNFRSRRTDVAEIKRLVDKFKIELHGTGIEIIKGGLK